jgi:hypothetical protein
MTAGNFLYRADIQADHDIEADLIRLREAEADELWAVLSVDLCQARVAAARVTAIKARLAARPL